MRVAYFVVGAEGSGTYMLWNALQAAGCHAEGWHNGEQYDYKFRRMPDLFAFRRSLPHAGVWPNLNMIAAYMKAARYSVVFLPIIRESHSQTLSILNRRPTDTFVPEIYQANLHKALRFVGGIDVSLFSVQLVTYEGFCLSEKYRRHLFEKRLKLSYPADFEIKFGNDKYYE